MSLKDALQERKDFLIENLNLGTASLINESQLRRLKKQIESYNKKNYTQFDVEQIVFTENKVINDYRKEISLWTIDLKTLQENFSSYEEQIHIVQEYNRKNNYAA